MSPKIYINIPFKLQEYWFPPIFVYGVNLEKFMKKFVSCYKNDHYYSFINEDGKELEIRHHSNMDDRLQINFGKEFLVENLEDEALKFANWLADKNCAIKGIIKIYNPTKGFKRTKKCWQIA